MQKVIQTKGLARRFGSRWAYARIDFEVLQGERFLLLGANGSGKTTLLRTLATLLTPSLGAFQLFESARHPSAHRSKIGYLSHHTGLYEDISVQENLRIFGSFMGLSLFDDEIDFHVARVGLDHRTDPIRSYSAGMRKRASIAVALLKKPDLLLLDEPFAALDPRGVEDMCNVISSLEATVVIASHQVQRAGELCDKAMLLEEGQIRWKGNSVDGWDAYQRSVLDLTRE